MQNKKKSSLKLICLVGPTATGKTKLALELAHLFSAELINADSRQIYRELNIGTAKPSAQELSQTPYHLIDCASIEQPWSAGTFIKEADQIISQVRERGGLPVLVGGTGLYLRTLLQGLSLMPDISQEIKDRVQTEYHKQGLTALYERLKQCDPQLAQSLSPQDTQRILRAVEVFEQTGKSLREFWKTDPQDKRYDYIMIGLNSDRQVLYERINQRVDQMMQEGLKEEAGRLWQIFPDNMILKKTIGYAEWIEYGFDKQEIVVEKIKQNTRNYAKRQMTWFRKEAHVSWFEAENFSAVKDFLNRQFSDAQ